MNNAWKIKQREISWDTHLKFVDAFLDDEDCFLIDQMRDLNKFLIETICSMTQGVLSTYHTKGKANKYDNQDQDLQYRSK